MYKNYFLGEKLKIVAIFFLEILTKFSDFENVDNCIRKITSKSTRLQPVSIKNIYI